MTTRNRTRPVLTLTAAVLAVFCLRQSGWKK